MSDLVMSLDNINDLINDAVNANNAKWKQAIEDSKAEINGQSYAYYDSEEIIDIIDKHTKELL